MSRWGEEQVENRGIKNIDTNGRKRPLNDDHLWCIVVPQRNNPQALWIKCSSLLNGILRASK
jgi:hypothetical protein